MDYPLEQLGPERFQQVCQALLVKEFPELQCLPVAQPDGGRDAFLYSGGAASIVFQVKFVRQPTNVSEIHDWLESIIDKERQKVEKLASRNTQKYILLTNVAGSSHIDRGSIDKVQRILDTLPVSASCRWRDDINRRLDGEWSVKWAYPELMTGPDLIRSIVESGLREHERRRASTLRAYLTDQYDRDSQVKFKQVELQNRLLDLFVDGPVQVVEARSDQNSRSRHRSQAVPAFLRIQAENAAGVDAAEQRSEDVPVAAANLFLHPLGQEFIQRAVLEGAPGQGKSTVTQYLCQVHRIRILGHEDANRLPEAHRSLPARLPLRVDLRDLSQWLTGVHPFPSTEEEQVSTRSLEAFLAAHISAYSGGAHFNVDDLLAISQISSVLLVFDGLDEVANIRQRQEVVDEISGGVKRLSSNSPSLQVIITSRPAAFANSPGLPRAQFQYFQLDELPRGLVEEYATKWIAARSLTPREAKDVRSILREKLESPHLRDLARNPMQLAILLSLIHTRGSSLPDKRTALYDSYVELFFNRESEKSPVVRDHRDTLIAIHRYLAWVLHARAEIGRKGSIKTEDLLKLVEDYLRSEGHNPAIAQELFNGMVERVVAIVSRVEGTYEFEVQPLREYFAARHLFETAPYSPPGNERSGTRPDRFDALARNFYWLNVTRFYAGCYSKGELPSLIEGLKALLESAEFKHLSHPRILAAMLLTDWVFTQYPRSVRQILDILFDGTGLYSFVSRQPRYQRTAPLLTLPSEAGRTELIETAYSLIQSNPVGEIAEEAADIIRANNGEDQIKSRWEIDALGKGVAERDAWLYIGLHLGYFAQASPDQLSKFFGASTLGAQKVQILLSSGNANWIESDEKRFDEVIRGMLRRIAGGGYHTRNAAFIEAMESLLSPETFGAVYMLGGSRGFAESLGPEVPWQFWDPGKFSLPVGGAYDQARQLSQAIWRELEKPVALWTSSVEPWHNIVETVRATYGDASIMLPLAGLAAAVRSSSEQYPKANALLDRSVPLCHRARYARLRAGQPQWWAAQLSQLSDATDHLTALPILVGWGSQATLVGLADQIEQVLLNLPRETWAAVYQLTSSLHSYPSRVLTAASVAHVAGRGERLTVLFGARASYNEKKKLFNVLSGYRGSDPVVLRFALHLASIELRAPDPQVGACVDFIEHAVKQGVGPDYGYGYPLDKPILPPAVARSILDRQKHFPRGLIQLAEATLRAEVGRSMKALIHVARDNRWFS